MRLTLFALFLALGISAAYGEGKKTVEDVAPSCEKTLRFDLLTMHGGEEFPFKRVKKLEISEPGASYMKLGEGGTAQVFRVSRRASIQTYGQKEYRFPLNRDNDVDGFTVLRSAPPHLGVQILAAIPLGERTMQMPDVQGKTLRQVIEEGEILRLEKKHLLEVWTNYVLMVHQHFANVAEEVKLTYDDIGGSPMLSFSIMHAGKKVEIWLKSNNVIVEAKTGLLIIIDPY